MDNNCYSVYVGVRARRVLESLRARGRFCASGGNAAPKLDSGLAGYLEEALVRID